jgi:hypothetical protein
LINVLRHAQIFESDSILVKLQVFQDGKLMTTVSNRSDLHFRQDNFQLEVFIPRLKDRQSICYNRALPSHLLDWILTDPRSNIKLDISEKDSEKSLRIITYILQSDSVVLDELLDYDGIAAGDLDQDTDSESEDEIEYNFQRDVINNANVNRSHGSRPETPFETTGSETTESMTLFGTPATAVESSPSSSGRSSPSPQNEHISASSRFAYGGRQKSLPPSSPPAEDQKPLRETIRSPMIDAPADAEIRQYENLLERVVAPARRSSFPTQGVFDMSALLDALPGIGETSSQ